MNCARVASAGVVTTWRITISRYFSGCRERVLARDGWRCRVCDVATDVVHHRRSGVDRDEWLITLCPACHATVERLQFVDRYLPPLLRLLWREQHSEIPDAQLPFELGGAAE